MIVSWDWLREYVQVDAPLDEVTARLTMSGLNLEGVSQIGDDTAVDLEVTSNRPDCLGHIGVAREMAVLFGQPLSIPRAHVTEGSAKASDATSVVIECEDLCPRYVARVICGVRIGPSPDWLKRRLTTLGIATINNVVDITNYVLMECGQPLHAFDFDKLGENRIVVRRPGKGEKIVAIDQREYELDTDMCIIADAARPVAIGGVMGGLDTEIGDATLNVLIEAAQFAPLSVRTTARKLTLHSDSSYRFERGVDPHQLDWASRRCCELILELAGGELAEGSVVAGGEPSEKRPPILLRFAQVPRILGIDVAPAEGTQILSDLGLEPSRVDEQTGEFTPPSWRNDLTREIDLIEEIARIHGYDKIPDDIEVPVELSTRTHHDRVIERVRDVLTGAGCFEAITMSFVSEDERQLFTPHGDTTPLTVDHSSRRHENVLRQSLIPSLLKSRRENERHGTFDAQLFEIAKVYWKAAPDEDERDVEPAMIGIITGRPFAELKGVLELLVDRLNHSAALKLKRSDLSQFAAGRGAELSLDGRFVGWLGELDRNVTDRLDLRDAVTVAELHLAVLEDIANLSPVSQPLSQYPAVPRDLNFVLEEAVSWQELEAVVRKAGGPLLEDVSFGGQYRGKQIGPNNKSYIVTVSYRSAERTLTGAEVADAEQAIIAACRDKLGASLRS